MKVVVLHDAIAPGSREDQLDTLVQAEAVSQTLAVLGHLATKLPFPLDLPRFAVDLRAAQPDLVFNLVESVDGHSRLLPFAPALLDAWGIPCTGGTADSLYLTTNKLLAKRLMKAHGVPTPAWWSRSEGLVGEADFPARFIIKRVSEEASVGIDDQSIIEVEDLETLVRTVEQATQRLGDEAFAELYIDGREFNLSILESEAGPEVLPPAEIHFENYPPAKPKIVNYAAKWIENSFEYHHTPRLFDFAPSDEPLVAQLSELARACWRLFDLRGYVRVDFRVDPAGRPWVLEINVNPCISHDAGFVAAAQRAGLTYEQLIERIVTCAGPHRPPKSA